MASYTTGEISYSEGGVTYYYWKVKITQAASTRAGYVRFGLDVVDRHGGWSWDDINGRQWRVYDASGNQIAISDSNGWSNTAYVEFKQSYLNGSLTFNYGYMGDATVSSSNLLSTFKRTYTLTMTAGTGVASLTATRTGSMVSGDTVKTGSIVYEGDAISWTAAYSSGYTGNTRGTFNVSSTAVTLTVTGTLKTYTLVVTVGEHATVTVTKNGEEIHSGDVITYGDVLTVTMTADSGYALVTQSIRVAGKSAESPVTVTGDVVIIAACEAMSTTHIAGEIYLIKIYDGSWGDYRAMIANAAGDFESYS